MTEPYAYLKQLEYLTLVSKGRVASPLPGSRPSTAYGHSAEVTDYRPYHPGDDVRSIDWNLYARFHKPFVRLRHAEAELDVHILLDTSHSMEFGSPPKLAYAREIVLALSYVGLHNLDRVGLATFSDRLHHHIPLRRGKHQLLPLLDVLQAVTPAGKSNLHRAFKEYARQATRPGLLIIVSDFFAEGGYQEGLRYLLARRFDLMLVHVLAAEELQPRLDGSVTLRDLESPHGPEVTVDEDAVGQYVRNMQAFLAAVEAFCLEHHLTYARTLSGSAFEDTVARLLRAGVWHSR